MNPFVVLWRLIQLNSVVILKIIFCLCLFVYCSTFLFSKTLPYSSHERSLNDGLQERGESLRKCFGFFADIQRYFEALLVPVLVVVYLEVLIYLYFHPCS